MMVTECCCYIGVNWDGHKVKGVKSGHDLPWTAEAGSNLYSQSMCPLLAGSSRPCPQGHTKYKKCVLGKGKILFCHHIRLKQKENLQRMTLSAGSTFSISLGCTARILCALKLRHSCEVNQMTSCNPKEGLSGGDGVRKLWTPTMWSRAVGSGLALPTPKSDKAGLCQFAIWSAWKAPVWK